MTTSTRLAQRQKAALTTLDFQAECWSFAASPDIPNEGHDARSRYVEEFWLPVLGPTCIVILRHFADSLRHGGSFGVSLKELPHLFGLGSGYGPNSLFGRSITRLVAFEMAELDGPSSVLVKTVVPWLTSSQVARLHPWLQIRHGYWTKNFRHSY
jgi:hypothetical protein